LYLQAEFCQDNADDYSFLMHKFKIKINYSYYKDGQKNLDIYLAFILSEIVR